MNLFKDIRKEQYYKMGCLYIGAILIGVIIALVLALIIATVLAQRVITAENIQCALNNLFAQEHQRLKTSANTNDKFIACLMTNLFSNAKVPIATQVCAVDITTTNV